MHKIINVSGTEVYIDGNKDKTIVMLHGWPDTHEIWQKQVDFFKENYTCVTFTLLGFTKNDDKKYTLDEIIQRIRDIVNTVSPDKKIILMLHDWGCVFGYEYAMRYADKVEKMIGVDIGDTSSKEFRDSLSVSAKMMLFTYQITLAIGYFSGDTIGRAINKTIAKGLKARSNFDNIHRGMSLPYAMRWLGVAGGLKQLHQFKPSFPFFYCYATKKPFFFHSASWLNQLQKNTENKVQSFDCSHWVMVDKADEFNQSVKDWLIQK